MQVFSIYNGLISAAALKNTTTVEPRVKAKIHPWLASSQLVINYLKSGVKAVILVGDRITVKITIINNRINIETQRNNDPEWFPEKNTGFEENIPDDLFAAWKMNYFFGSSEKAIDSNEFIRVTSNATFGQSLNGMVLQIRYMDGAINDSNYISRVVLINPSETASK